MTVSFFFFLQPVCQDRGRRLINNTQDIQPCDLAGRFGGLALGVVKVGRDGNHRIFYLALKNHVL
jgi:hypothetical protein